MKLPSTRVDRDRAGELGRWAGAGRDILSLCLPRLEPRVPIHPLTVQRKDLSIVQILTDQTSDSKAPLSYPCERPFRL